VSESECVSKREQNLEGVALGREVGPPAELDALDREPRPKVDLHVYVLHSRERLPERAVTKPSVDGALDPVPGRCARRRRFGIEARVHLRRGGGAFRQMRSRAEGSRFAMRNDDAQSRHRQKHAITPGRIGARAKQTSNGHGEEPVIIFRYH